MRERPINDWILVELEPVETMVGSIFIQGGSIYRKAKVLATGPGKEFSNGVRVPVGVEPGERVAFCRAHETHLQGKAVAGVVGGDKFLIKPEDILFVMDEDVRIS